MSFATYLKKRISLFPWLIVAGVSMTLFVCKSCRSSIEYFLSVSALTITCWALMWFGNEYLHEYLDEKIDWTKHPIKRLIGGIGCYAGVYRTNHIRCDESYGDVFRLKSWRNFEDNLHECGHYVSYNCLVDEPFFFI